MPGRLRRTTGRAAIPGGRFGGDLYDHFLMDRKLWFMVGDVSGKGVGAALFMARAMTMLRATAGPGADRRRS